MFLEYPSFKDIVRHQSWSNKESISHTKSEPARSGTKIRRGDGQAEVENNSHTLGHDSRQNATGEFNYGWRQSVNRPVMHTKTDKTSSWTGRQIDDTRHDPRGQDDNACLLYTSDAADE